MFKVVTKTWTLPVSTVDGELVPQNEDRAAVLRRVWHTWLDLAAMNATDAFVETGAAAAVTALSTIETKDLLQPGRLLLLSDMAQVFAQKINPQRSAVWGVKSGNGRVETCTLIIKSVAGYDVVGDVEAVRVKVTHRAGEVVVELRVCPDVLSGEEQYLIDHIDATILPA